MKRIVLLFCFATVASAQTISPLYAEYGKKASGSFQIINTGLTPLHVTLEAHGFDIATNGTATLTPLPANVDLQLGATSATVPIKGQHSFYYRMKCASIPCRVEILAFLMSGAKTSEGLKVVLALPTAIYICQQKKDCRLETLRGYGYDPTPAKK